jgi:cell wall-associated NlpC family hydrolase
LREELERDPDGDLAKDTGIEARIEGAIDAYKAAVAAVSAGAADPPALEAVTYALSHLGDKYWAVDSAVNPDGFSRVPADTSKCNIFVAMAYKEGAGVPYPHRSFYGICTNSPAMANDLAYDNHVGDLEKVRGPLRLGDIVGFAPAGGRGAGHAALYVGNGIVVYASGTRVKARSFAWVAAFEHNNGFQAWRYPE